MQIDIERIKIYLDQIITETAVIANIITVADEEILCSARDLRSIKYSLIIISEAIANTLHHFLAKKFQVAVSGYREVLTKSAERNLITQKLSNSLFPFVSFRNMLVHQYWEVDDKTMLTNLRDGLDDFKLFVKEIKNLIDSKNG